jgi:hypothetical protein
LLADGVVPDLFQRVQFEFGVEEIVSASSRRLQALYAQATSIRCLIR